MNKRFINSKFWLSVLLLTSSHWCYAGEKGKESGQYQIVSIKAFLYFDQRGTVSENIIDNPAYGAGALWDTIIGGGSAGSPSNATMVVVEVAGKRGAYENKRKLDFVASERNKIVFHKELKLGVLSESGRYYAAFWLYDTGCAPITLSAKISGQSKDSRLEKKIDFECGE